MKPIKFWAVCLAFIAISASAQTPPNIEAALKNKYPDATIKKLKHKKGGYVAFFTNEGKKCNATFSNNGTWVETKTAMKWKELPKAVRSGLVKSPYSTWLIEDAAKVDTPAGTMYSVEVDNEYTLDGDHQYADAKTCYVYFTPSGSFIKEEDL